MSDSADVTGGPRGPPLPSERHTPSVAQSAPTLGDAARVTASALLAATGETWPPRASARWVVLSVSAYLLAHAAVVALLPTRGTAAAAAAAAAAELVCGVSDAHASGDAAACAANLAEGVGNVGGAFVARAWVGSAVGEVSNSVVPAALSLYAVAAVGLLMLPTWSCVRGCVKCAHACALVAVALPLFMLALVPVGLRTGPGLVAKAGEGLDDVLRVVTTFNEGSDLPSAVHVDISSERDRNDVALDLAEDDAPRTGKEELGRTVLLALREGYFLGIDALYGNTASKSTTNSEDQKYNFTTPGSCSIGGSDGEEGQCSADRSRSAEFEEILRDAMASFAPDLRLACLWESALNCRGFSNDDCLDGSEGGSCVSGEYATRGSTTPCRCLACPRVAGLDKPRGCATAVIERGAAAFAAVRETRLSTKAVVAGIEAAWLLVLLALLSFVLVWFT